MKNQEVMKKQEVILDTNFLLVPYQLKLDIFSELAFQLEPPYLLLVPTSAISELKKLSKNKGKQGMAAKFALKLVIVNKDAGKLSVVKGTAPVDDWIVAYSKEHSAIVCTNDEKLRNRLKAGRIRMIVINSRSRLGFA